MLCMWEREAGRRERRRGGEEERRRGGEEARRMEVPKKNKTPA